MQRNKTFMHYIRNMGIDVVSKTGKDEYIAFVKNFGYKLINHINKNNPVIGSSSIDDVIKSARKHPENLNDTLSQLIPETDV